MKAKTFLVFVAISLLSLAAILIVKRDIWHYRAINLSQSAGQANWDMVMLDDYVPGIVVELRYAGSNNVFGEAVYKSSRAQLRRGTADLLKAAELEFEQNGYHLKIWDAYRSTNVQYILWEKMPDVRFVVDPHRSFSYHSRGAAVDVTLVDEQGRELIMPSDFDDFSSRANRDYSDVDRAAAKNASYLEEVMKRNGFKSIYNEWWHFADREAEKYPVAEE